MFCTLRLARSPLRGNNMFDGEISGAVPGPTQRRRYDRLAIGLSVACLVHCIALPVALLLAPTLGPVMLGTESPVHWVLLGLALPVSVYALWHGYRAHRQVVGLWLGALGLVIMLVAVSHVFDRSLETVLTVIGVTLLLVAHLLNLRNESAHRTSAR
jgi:MerC mercury resistance protein